MRRRALDSILLLSVLVAADLPAAARFRPANLLRERSRDICFTYLAAAAEEYIPLDETENGFAAGSLDELPELLREISASAGFRNEVHYRLEEIRQVPLGHPLAFLRSVLHHRVVRDRLFLLLPEASSRLTDRGQGHFDAIYSNLELTTASLRHWELGLSDECAAQPLRTVLYAAALRIPMHHPVAERPVRWLGTLTHEVTHAVTVELLSRWLVANQRLLLARQPLDPLFVGNIRFRPFPTSSRHGTWVANRGFYFTLLESLAYRNQARYLRAESVSAEGGDELERELRASAIREIRSNGGTAFLLAERIAEANVFEWATTTEQAMAGTLGRARTAGASFRRR